MSAAAQPIAPFSDSETPRDTTLLELVRALSEVTNDEREVVATVMSLLRSGQVRLCGNFRDAPLEDLIS